MNETEICSTSKTTKFFLYISSKIVVLKSMHLGLNFFLSKNVGLNIPSGYLEIFYPFLLSMSINELLLYYHANSNYFIIIKSSGS
jgi:hypothetical protein